MELNDLSQLNSKDVCYIQALRTGDNAKCHEFFYKEIAGLLHRIRSEVFHGLVDFDEMVSELYLYLSRDDWAKLGGFAAKNNCRLRTWMIPVAWRYFIGVRDRLVHVGSAEGGGPEESAREDLRIQIAIDVTAVLDRMPNKRYAEILRLLLIDGYGAQDVAEMLGMRVENVYNIKHRAVSQFLELYGKR